MSKDVEAEFSRMVEDSQPALVRLARRYAGQEDWQDLLQDMHLQLWRSFNAFEGRAQRSTWVYRVALNTALSHVRKLRYEHYGLDKIAEQGDGGHVVDPLDVLDAFLATLDPMQRSVLLLDLEGLPREQIAEVLGLTPNAVAVRMTRLRQSYERLFLEN